MWIVAAYSCTGHVSGTHTTYYNIARVTSMSVAHDSVPALKKTAFTIYETANAAGLSLQEADSVGLIINLDSIAYGTDVDSVRINFTFYSTPSRAVLSMDTAQLYLTGSDTISLWHDSIYLDIVSGDGTAQKRYRILPRIHHVDPDLMTWQLTSRALYPEQSAEQGLNIVDGTLYLHVNNGSETTLYTAQADGYQTTGWSEQSVSGLPALCHTPAILHSQEHFYYADPTGLYQSTDGAQWTSIPTGKELLTTLFAFEDEEGEIRPWLLSAAHELYILRADTLAYYTAVEANTFPISGFTTARFVSASSRARLTMIGGFAKDGSVLRNRYNWEYNTITDTIRMTDFSQQVRDFTALVNAAVVPYNNQLLLFGAQTADYDYIGRIPYQSSDEGMSWQKVDSTKCNLPESYGPRRNVCVAAHNGYIYVIGGSDNSHDYSDVYVGRLQSIDW